MSCSCGLSDCTCDRPNSGSIGVTCTTAPSGTSSVDCSSSCCTNDTDGSRCGVFIAATERDPYYIDDLAKALMTNNGMDPINVTIDGSIPVIKPFDCRTVYMPGFEGMPTTASRPYGSSYHLRSNPVLNVTQMPTGYNSRTNTRTSKAIDRDKSRWITIEATNVPPVADAPARMAPTHPIRGRGYIPWWRTGFPGVNPTTGLG